LAGGRVRAPDPSAGERLERGVFERAEGGRAMRGFGAVLRKEGIQMLRDKGTLRFALAVPVFQLILFGLIDTNVHNVPTVVFDQSRSPESRELVADFTNTSYFE